MPLPVVRSPLGLPLGDRGLLPLPDALPGVGAGVVAGGPYTVPKGCWIPIPGRPAGRGQGLFLPHIPPHILSHIAGRGVVVEAPRACPGHGPFRPRRRPSHWGPSLSPLPHPRTHPAHPSRSRRSVEAPVRGPPLVRMSRGRPPMRGPGGAPHGRCQPERWAGSGSVVGQGRQQGALIGGGAWGGHRGARRGGSGGG